MKYLFLTLSSFGLNLWAAAQSASVEKSIFGIQTGLGIWVYNEARLSNQIALRSELGLSGGYEANPYNQIILFAPEIRLEPRWYYNFKKRESKSKKINGNSGNFISINTSYNPDWFVISNHENLQIISRISFVPTWGIRRNIGKHFDFEVGFGIGYQFILPTLPSYPNGYGEPIGNLHLRFGYHF